MSSKIQGMSTNRFWWMVEEQDLLKQSRMLVISEKEMCSWRNRKKACQKLTKRGGGSKLHFKSKYCLWSREFEKTKCRVKYLPRCPKATLPNAFSLRVAPSYGTSSCSSTGTAKWGRGSKPNCFRKSVPVTWIISLKEPVIHLNLSVPLQAKISVFIFTLVKQLN